MSIYGELNSEPEHRTQFAFKGKREHIVKVNIPNAGYPNQHIDVAIPAGSRDQIIVPDTLKITFNLEVESKDKTRSVVNNVGRALVKKKVLMLGSKEIDTVNQSYIYGTYKDLYLSKQEREEELLQGIQSATGLKARVGATKADGTALTLTKEENAIKKTVSNRFSIPLDFDFFKHPTYPYGLREDLIGRLELNSAKKILLASGDTAATYKISDIALEYDAIFDLDCAAMFENLYSETSIPCTKVTAVHHQALSKKSENWKIDINNLSVRSLQELLLLFVEKQSNFGNENEKFYNPSIKKILTTINGIPHQLYPGGLLSRDIFPEAKMYWYKPDSDVTWGEFLTTKFGLWIDVRSSNDNRLHGSGRTVERSGILLQIERAADASNGDLVCYFFSLEDAVAHNTSSGEILTIEKQSESMLFYGFDKP